MIKGRYVALVEIDFCLNENFCAKKMEMYRNGVTGGHMTDMIRDAIERAVVTDQTDVTVTQQYADVYEVHEE